MKLPLSTNMPPRPLSPAPGHPKPGEVPAGDRSTYPATEGLS
jgi:hypothetical protein